MGGLAHALAHGRLHGLRHGKNAAQVQRTVGHHFPAFTLATYVDLLPSDLADADYMNDVLPVASGGNDGATRQAEIGGDGLAALAVKSA